MVVDSGERARYKQLANDSIIATFGRDDNEARLAQALEKCLEWIGDMASNCSTCSWCPDHGNREVWFNDESDSDRVKSNLGGLP